MTPLSSAAFSVLPPPPVDDYDDREHYERDYDEGSSKRSQGQVLAELALERWRFGIDTTGRPMAVALDGPNVAQSLRGQGQSVRIALQGAYLAETGKPPASGSIADTLGALEGRCYEAEPEVVSLRVGTDPAGGVVLDLGDTTGRAVLVSAAGWVVVERSPVLFRRTAAMLPLSAPTPSSTGLDDLRALTNVLDGSWPLLIGWMVAALLPDIAHPILALTGEAGTGKTSLLKTICGLIDASSAPVRAMPRSIDDWQVAASASWVVPLDNLSRIDDKMSDALCRGTSGDGLVKRALYSDADVTILSFRRVIALNGIDLGTLRGDLGDRLLTVELEPITIRRAEADLEAERVACAPAALGHLLDLLSGVLAVLPTTPTPVDLRMADFARILAALDTVTGWSTLERYRMIHASTLARLVEGDSFAIAVRGLVDRCAGSWRGTSTQLRAAILKQDDHAGSWLPNTPNGVAGALKRCSPSLRAAGYDVTSGRDHAGRYVAVACMTRDAGDAPDGSFLEPAEPRDGHQRIARAVRWTRSQQSATADPEKLLPPASRASRVMQATATFEQVADGWCDVCGSSTLRQRPDGDWRHAACESKSPRPTS